MRGHIYKKCKKPIMSFGFIILQQNDDDLKNPNILLIQRKHSIGFINLIRGRFKHDLLRVYMNDLTHEEKYKLYLYLNDQNMFDKVWDDLWYKNVYSDEQKIRAKNKFYNHYNLFQDYMKMDNSKYIAPDWGFPKGRRMQHESQLQAAKRELMEETGIKPSQYTILTKKYYDEKFQGTDGVTYLHRYYIAMFHHNQQIDMDISESNEVGDIGFYPWKTAISMFRERHEEKKKVLATVIQDFQENDLGE